MKTQFIALVSAIVALCLLFSLESKAASAKATIRVVTKQEAVDNCIDRLIEAVKPKTAHQLILIVRKCEIEERGNENNNN
jgi:hypothetical protein